VVAAAPAPAKVDATQTAVVHTAVGDIKHYCDVDAWTNSVDLADTFDTVDRFVALQDKIPSDVEGLVQALRDGPSRILDIGNGMQTVRQAALDVLPILDPTTCVDPISEMAQLASPSREADPAHAQGRALRRLQAELAL
jgi:hypothetical protein